ncbi:MAG: protelomerase family protein, partial [Phormidesmis sp.]
MSSLSPLAEKALEQCSTQWLKTLLREFLPQIIGLPNTPAGQQQAKQWDALIKERMALRGLETPTQQKNPITDVRQVIKTIDPQHPALDEVGFTKEEWTEINMPSEQAVARRTAKPIANPEEIVRRAEGLLKSDSWSEIAAGLAVVTGRRAAEVMQTAQFEQASQWSVWFTGALKRRGEEVELRFEIPTLVKAASVISATKRLRRAVDTSGMSNREINRAYSHAIAQACDRTFTDLVPSREGKDNLYTHLFRAVYSTIATFWYCPSEVPELEFRAAIQGHYQILEEGQTELRRSLAASRHYFDYEIADKVIAAYKGQRKGIKLEQPDVEVISAFKPKLSEVKPQEDIVMSRIGITEDDKQRVL